MTVKYLNKCKGANKKNQTSDEISNKNDVKTNVKVNLSHKFRFLMFLEVNLILRLEVTRQTIMTFEKNKIFYFLIINQLFIINYQT